MQKKMLVPLDGSEISEILFAYAEELAGRLNLDILLLHVCTLEEYELHPMHRRYVEHAADRIRQHSEAVRSHTSESREKRRIDVRGILAVGPPAEEILRCVDDNNIDFVMMATHGHHWILATGLQETVSGLLKEPRTEVCGLQPI